MLASGQITNVSGDQCRVDEFLRCQECRTDAGAAGTVRIRLGRDAQALGASALEQRMHAIDVPGRSAVDVTQVHVSTGGERCSYHFRSTEKAAVRSGKLAHVGIGH